MSRAVPVMTGGRAVLVPRRGAHGGRAQRPTPDSSRASREPFLTVPLLCCRAGNGFQAEGLYQIKGGVAQGQAVDAGPQVDHVSLAAALPGEALEDAVGEVHTEGAAACVAAVDRTGAAALRALATQARRQAELVEHGRDRQLPLDVREVHGA